MQLIMQVMQVMQNKNAHIQRMWKSPFQRFPLEQVELGTGCGDAPATSSMIKGWKRPSDYDEELPPGIPLRHIMSVTAHATGQEDAGNQPVWAWGLFSDGDEEDRVPAMKYEAWKDIMQVRTTGTPLDINSLGFTGLSKVLRASLTACLCVHLPC